MGDTDPLGRILAVEPNGDGTTNVLYDNGVTSLMIVHTLDTDLNALLAEDPKLIHRLMSQPEPGARNKVTERKDKKR